MRSFPASNISMFVALMTSANSGQNPWGSGGAGGIGGLMLQAWQWIVDRCNAPDVGYDQNYRNEQTINGITYYDCSSLIFYGLGHAGFEINLTAWPFTTKTMPDILKSLGFEEIILPSDYSDFKFQKGDILWIHDESSGGHQHTEMMYDDTHSMGAHSKHPPLPDQVSINTYTVWESTIHFWRVYRWPFSGGNWIIGGSSEYFGDSASELCGHNEKAINNANVIKDYFLSQGWTINAIAGLCGNIQQESTFNPALQEVGAGENGGHGLVQWTPPTDLFHVMDVLYGSHADWTDGQKQLSVIYAEFQQSTGIKNWGIDPQWYPRHGYNLTWREWTQSTADAGYLAMAFQEEYERPYVIHPEREAFGQRWYKYFTTGE